MHKTFLVLHMLGLIAGAGTSVFMSVLAIRIRGTDSTDKALVNLHEMRNGFFRRNNWARLAWCC